MTPPSGCLNFKDSYQVSNHVGQFTLWQASKIPIDKDGGSGYRIITVSCLHFSAFCSTIHRLPGWFVLTSSDKAPIAVRTSIIPIRRDAPPASLCCYNFCIDTRQSPKSPTTMQHYQLRRWRFPQRALEVFGNGIFWGSSNGCPVCLSVSCVNLFQRRS